MKKSCPVCSQKMDIFTTAHKNAPFVDNRTYPAMCFTCYFVPKTHEQRYGRDGSVSEDIELEYSPKNLHTPKELHDSGASETIKQAKLSVAAVEALCRGVRPPKKPIKRPSASWNMC
jgi:hypothetical protein